MKTRTWKNGVLVKETDDGLPGSPSPLSTGDFFLLLLDVLGAQVYAAARKSEAMMAFWDAALTFKTIERDDPRVSAAMETAVAANIGVTDDMISALKAAWPTA